MFAGIVFLKMVSKLYLAIAESLNECSLLTCEKKKRKHPDLSDGSEDDLTNLDLDSYLSEDDPDYEVQITDKSNDM